MAFPQVLSYHTCQTVALEISAALRNLNLFIQEWNYVMLAVYNQQRAKNLCE